MPDNRLPVLLAMLWAGLMSGFFWAFSIVVMPGLAQTDTAVAMTTMQAINAVVRNPLFAVGFFGAPVICVAAAIWDLWRRPGIPAVLTASGATTYLIGGFVVTFTVNVPMNEALAMFAPSQPAGLAVMADYLRDWPFWNHVRTITSLAATALFGLSAMMPRVAARPAAEPAQTVRGVPADALTPAIVAHHRAVARRHAEAETRQ